MSETTEKLSTLQEVAARFKVNERTIRRWLNSGKIDAILMERQYRFEEKEIKRFMDLRRRAKKRRDEQ